MSWGQALAVVPAVLAVLTGAVMAYTGQWWTVSACLVMAVVFGLEAAGVESLLRTRRVLEKKRRE